MGERENAKESKMARNGDKETHEKYSTTVFLLFRFSAFYVLLIMCILTAYKNENDEDFSSCFHSLLS